MGLHIIQTRAEGLVNPIVLGELRRALSERGSVTLLVPAGSQVLPLSKALAHEDGLGLGVSVSTLPSWAKEQWEVYGDGRLPQDPLRRGLELTRLVARAQTDGTLDPLDSGPGTVRLISDVARVALPQILQTEPGDQQLTSGEQTVAKLLRAYHSELVSSQRVEDSELLFELPSRLPARRSIVLCLGVSMPPEHARLVAKLALNSEVTCVASMANGPASDALRATCAELKRLAAELGANVSESIDSAPPVPNPQRSPQLQELLLRLFHPGEAGAEPLPPTEAVQSLYPAGPLAEPEAVAAKIGELAQAGARHVALMAPKPPEAWDLIAPRLAARGIGVRANLGQSVLSTQVGRAFASFIAEVAQLADLAQNWPEHFTVNDETFDARELLTGRAPKPADPLVVNMAGLARVEELALGDMSWWPPRALTDFLLSDLSMVPRENAWELDSRWRSNRILSPSEVLAQLRKSSLSSAACAEAVQQLVERGSVASAARALARALEDAATSAPWSDLAKRSEALAALHAYVQAEQTARALGMRNQREKDAPDDAMSLSDYVNALVAAVDGARLSTRSCLPGTLDCEVELLSPYEAALLPPASADALVVMGLDTKRSPIPRSDSAYLTLLSKLGLGPISSPLSVARANFYACASTPRDYLVLERCLYDEGSNETFEAVMLTEVESCFQRPDAKAGHQSCRGEDLISQNLSERCLSAIPHETEALPSSGRLSAASRALVTVPAGNGKPDDGALTLSATQLETYLDCPLKWFVARRIGLETPDAGFGSLEAGSFAHRVLELTHQQLLEEAYFAAHPNADPELPVQEQPGFDPCERLGGSRVTPETLPRATQLLDSEFVRHLAHQYSSGTRRALQAYIPHVPSQRHELQRLRDDLASALEYESTLFEGFEPRFFELPFGRANLPEVAFAGARFNGTIDRVDVDAEGHAIVIDYKHKRTLFDEYALFGKELAAVACDGAGIAAFELPRHIQTLVYARALKQLMPRLEVVGVVYLGTRREHDLSGAVTGRFAERIFGRPLSTEELARVAVPGEAAGMVGVRSFDELLERSEEELAEVVKRMKDGIVEANPRGSDGDPRFAYVCSWCPVSSCERRRS